MRRILKWLAMAVGLIAVVLAGLLGYAYYDLSHPDRTEPLSLPDGMVAIDSDEGRQLLGGALAADHPGLARSFQTQQKGSWCGVASSVTVLNARGAELSQEGFFTDAATEVRPWFRVTFGGMPLSALTQMLAAHGVQSSAYYAEETSVEAFREALKANMANPEDQLIINYDRRVLKEAGGGHISPISAYAADADMALVLDTAAYKYPHHWVSVKALFEAMNTQDSESGRSRGWVVVRSPFGLGP